MTHSRWGALVAAAALLLGGPVVRACDKDGSAAKGGSCPAVRSCSECCEPKAGKCEDKCTAGYDCCIVNACKGGDNCKGCCECCEAKCGGKCEGKSCPGCECAKACKSDAKCKGEACASGAKAAKCAECKCCASCACSKTETTVKAAQCAECKCCASCACSKARGSGAKAAKCAGECKCCASCACSKASAKLPKCTCPAGTKCAEGCTADACCCKTKDGAAPGSKPKKSAVKKKAVGCDEASEMGYVGGCLMELAPMPQQMVQAPMPMPPFMPMLMLLENLCPPQCLLPPPPPFHGMMPAGFPVPPPCCGEACPCMPEMSSVSLSHEVDGIHVSSPFLKECVCKKVSLVGPMGCLMLENVKLVTGAEGSKMHIVADRLCLDPRTGRIQLEASKGSSGGLMPACFQVWSGFFE